MCGYGYRERLHDVDKAFSRRSLSNKPIIDAKEEASLSQLFFRIHLIEYWDPYLGIFWLNMGWLHKGSNASRRTRSTMEERQTDMYRGMNEVPRSHGPTRAWCDELMVKVILCVCIHTYIHTFIHTYIHTHIDIYIYIYLNSWMCGVNLL